MRNTVITICLALLPTLLFGQRTLTGVVLDGSMQEEPLMGAAVQVVGTTIGTITDMDGRFQLEVPADGKQIEVSYLGYQDQVVDIAGRDVVRVVLMEDTEMVEEVVVVGYGTVKKSDLSGSVSHIEAKDLLGGYQQDVAGGLQGKIAGVEVSASDGAPGAAMSITVRGANSFTTSSQPLYIVDGVPFGTSANGVPSSDANEGNNQQTSPLAMINPNDIESIEVLKDASATAIYGSRGANGVVIITTKKGKNTGEAKPVVELNVKLGLQQVSRQIDMLDAYTYALYQNEAAANSLYYEGVGKTLPYRGEWDYPYIGSGYDYQHGTYNPSPEDFLNPGVREDRYGNRSEVSPTNWQEQIYRLGWTQDYSLSVSHGSDKGWYNFSLGYSQQEGVVKNTGYDRYTVSANIGRHITSWLEVGSSQLFSHTTTNFQRTNSENTGIIRSALIFPPTYGVHTETAQLDELNWLATNPVNYVNGAKDELKQISWFSSNYLEFTFTPWMRLRQNLGLGYNDGHRDTYYDRHTQEGKTPFNGKAGKATSIWKSLTAETILTFDKTWGSMHSLNAVLGFTAEGGWGENTSMTATNFASDATQGADISQALDRATVKSDETTMKMLSFLARVNYTLMQRYLFTCSVRTDGSSVFAANNKWATFLSGAFAWRMSEEGFMQDQNAVSNWKWRLSYGETGNQGIGAYRTLMVLQSSNYPYDGTLSSGYSTIDWRGPNNPDLRWETTAQANAGIDMGFLNNRLNIVVDYYYKRTRDLLQNITIPASSGYRQMLINSGNVTNQGVEITLDCEVLHRLPVTWHLSANFALNRNCISGLEGDQFATSLWSAADQVFIQRNGCPIGTLYGYVEDGFYDSPEEVRARKEYANYTDDQALRMVGEIKYRDLNGDGFITADDRTIIGNTNPDFTYALTSVLAWKGLSLSFMFQGSQGNDILNYNLTDIKLSQEGNITRTAYEGRWTPETAATATWPKASATYTRTWLVSDRYVEDGSYLKMKYITLAYDWRNPCKGIEKLGFNFTVNNVFTATRYSWYDPDVNAGGTNAAVRGVDCYSYPAARSYNIGINVVL
ncbi:MAG: SusC/RagA family TonB-linked outer membrane protein [Paludibacteraceae bacterium]